MSEARLEGAVVCEVCRMGLSVKETPTEDGMILEFFHGFLPEGVEDHVPVPAGAEFADQISVCDFCRAYGPRWTFPCEDFVDDALDLGEGAGWHSLGGWAACDACKVAIEADDYVEVLKRAVAHYSREGNAAALIGIAQMHQGFRAHRTGDPIQEY